MGKNAIFSSGILLSEVVNFDLCSDTKSCKKQALSGCLLDSSTFNNSVRGVVMFLVLLYIVKLFSQYITVAFAPHFCFFLFCFRSINGLVKILETQRSRY